MSEDVLQRDTLRHLTALRNTTALVGRDAELQHLREKLTGARLVTLLGPGGIGKTRLALELMGSLDRPGVFADFTSITDLTLAPEVLARALGWTLPGPDADTYLQRTLPGFAGLLVLDNLEHLPGVAARVQEWLTLAPHARALCTSREALSLRGEELLPLEALDLPAPDASSERELLVSGAGRLFVQRARQANALLELDAGTCRDIAGLCGRLDGLPLALELTAARMDLFTPGAALAWLNEGRSLPGVRGGRAERHRSVEAAVRWSYSLLNPDLQGAFRRLGAFEGHFGLAGASGVLEVEEGAARAALDELVAKSLLRRREVAGVERWVLLETVRNAAGSLLREMGEEDRALERHAEVHAALLKSVMQKINRERSTETILTAQVELEQMRAMLAWYTSGTHGRVEQVVLRVTNTFSSLALYLGTYAEMVRWLQRALAVTSGPSTERCLVMGQLGYHLAFLGRGEQGALYGERAIHEARELNHASTLAMCLWNATVGMVLDERWVEAEHLCAQCVAVCEQRGDEAGRERVLQNLWYIRGRQGRYAEAIAELYASLDRAERDRDIVMIVLGGARLGDLLMHQGDYERARRAYNQGEEYFTAANDVTRLGNLAHLEIECGTYESARALAMQAHALSLEYHDNPEGERTLWMRLLLAMSEIGIHAQSAAAGPAVASLRELLGMYRDRDSRRAWLAGALLSCALGVDGAAPEAAREGVDLAATALRSGKLDRWEARLAWCGLALCAARAGWVELGKGALAVLARQRELDPDRSGALELDLERVAREQLRGWEARAEVTAGTVIAEARDLLDRQVAVPGEREVVLARLLVRGLTNAQIAADLKFSVNTVRNRLSEVYRRHGVASREDFVRVARERGWLD